MGGNHTDHQRGHVLAASINLDVIAVGTPHRPDYLREVRGLSGRCDLSG
ncbi:MAG: galactokinase family protein [Ruminococcus sp.]